MSERPTILSGQAGPVRLERDDAGVAHITAASLDDALFGEGVCHARDRGLQILLMRILGQGRGCELLEDSAELLVWDRYFRRWNLGADAASEEAAISERARSAIEAYCRGVNLFFSKKKIPWELRLLGCRFEPWTVADCFLTAKLSGLIALAQAQTDMEQFIVECVQHGIKREQLEELFPGQLHGLDEELVRQVRPSEPLVPESLKWASALPRMMASNNWVVASARTASGRPFLCNDPHLEVNRLPAIWYEVVLRWPSADGPHYAMGASFPGLPGVSIGRTRDLAWGITYAFMDCMDSWVEDCRAGKYRRGNDWLPFEARKEIIRRKKNPPLELVFYDNPHGVLSGDPNEARYYLATCWSGRDGTSAAALDASCGILQAQSVAEGQTILGQISNSSWNWVLADHAGNIGYQMSGRAPRRRAGVSGLVPLPGWDPANDWQGFHAPEELPRAFNPPAGFLATANQDLNHLGEAKPINIPMASYRADRINAVLARPGKVTMEQMQKLQLDLYSRQAELFMPVIRPLLAEFEAQHGEAVQLLIEWDLTYVSESKAAFLFEQIYQALMAEVFGEAAGAFGGKVLEHLLAETCLFYDFYGNFDRVLVAENSVWFGARSRTEIYRAALAKALVTPPQPYGPTRKVLMRHLLFGGKLPLCLGFDRELELPGNRATLTQGQIYRGGGRETSFGPALRLVTDLATDEIQTSLAGGPSDRRFSKWYATGVADWVAGRYKTLHGPGCEPGPNQ
jgi:penicillin amidase